MRKLAVTAVTCFVITLTGCSNTPKTPQPPKFTPSSTQQPSIAPDTKLIQAINPCALVTPMDLREITGKQYFPMGETPVVDQSTHEQSCHYGAPEPALRVTTLLDSAKGTPVWDRYVKGHKTNAFVAVSNVGDGAFINHDVFLAARSGRVIIALERATPSADTIMIKDDTKLIERAFTRVKSSQ